MGTASALTDTSQRLHLEVRFEDLRSGGDDTVTVGRVARLSEEVRAGG
jgi:hypothetical protein